jgi:GNAT superfamily N-acetyltransferase
MRAVIIAGNPSPAIAGIGAAVLETRAEAHSSMEQRNELAVDGGNGRIAIRPANIGDIPEMISIGREMLDDEMPFITHNPDYMQRYFASFIDGENMLALVLEIEGTVAGFLMAMVFPSALSGELVGMKSSWVMRHRGQGMDLMRAAETWAASKGAKKLLASLPGEVPRKVMERMGYKSIEINYLKDLA